MYSILCIILQRYEEAEKSYVKAVQLDSTYKDAEEELFKMRSEQLEVGEWGGTQLNTRGPENEDTMILHTYAYAHMHARTHTSTHARTCTHTRTHTHTHMHTHAHTHTHTCTYTHHTHTPHTHTHHTTHTTARVDQ